MRKIIKGNYRLFIGFATVCLSFLVFLAIKTKGGINVLWEGGVLVLILGYIMFGLGYDYYIIEKNYVTVKNLFFWWKNKKFEVKDIRIFRVYYRGDGHLAITINNNKFTSNSLTREDVFELADTMQELLDIEVEFPQDPRKEDEDNTYYF